MLLCVADTPAWENLPFFQPAPRIIGGCCFHTNLDPQICSTPLVKKGRLSLSTILETFQQQLEPRDGQHWVPVLQIHKSPCYKLYVRSPPISFSNPQTRMVMMVMMIMLMISSRPDCRKGRLITNQTPLVAIDGQGGGGGAILMHHH